MTAKNRAILKPDQPPVENPPAPSLVKVRVLVSLGEDTGVYRKGDTFETTPERAAALGAHVELVTE
jgi:hypothetical protein